jgi:hypothetical protein
MGRARHLALALALGGCGSRTPLGGPASVDAAAVDAIGSGRDAAADAPDLDAPALIGPDLDAPPDPYLGPDACIALYDPHALDGGPTCIVDADCCQLSQAGPRVLCETGGRCVLDHPQ